MLIQADARQIPLRDGCVQCVCTSPPYFGLRNYGHPLQLGLEPTWELYVAALIEVFAEVWRVLKDDGVCWLNLGDSYANPDKGGYQPSLVKAEDSLQRGNLASDFPGAPNRMPQTGLKSKDLMMVPARAALALQAWGWYLRSDVIWSKPNPMPESVLDRPTKSHEYLFLLSKSPKYYYDAQAIAEPVSAAIVQQMEQGYEGLGLKDYEGAGVQNPSSVKARIIAGARARFDRVGGHKYDGETTMHSDGGMYDRSRMMRNRRSVWTVPTMPFNGWAQTSRRVRVSWDESDDDTTRTTSPDCPVHGDQAVLAAKVLCGGRAGDSSTDSGRTDNGLASTPLLDSVPTGPLHADYCEAESPDSSGQSHEPPATPRSKRSRKTVRALLTTSPYSVGAESPDGIGDILVSPLTSAEDSHKHESSTQGQDDLAVAALAETLGCTVGKCSCEYYKIITEKQSHFATMPEALVEPCILAGSKFGDLIFDPFSGSGTVLAVAERLGRRGVGTDLNPAYHALAKERTAQRGLRFVADDGAHP